MSRTRTRRSGSSRDEITDNGSSRDEITDNGSSRERTTHDVRLLRPHTHAGRARAAGDTITVDRPTADWLTHHGIGEVVDANTEEMH
jgi:hypothetical protein